MKLRREAGSRERSTAEEIAEEGKRAREEEGAETGTGEEEGGTATGTDVAEEGIEIVGETRGEARGDIGDFAGAD